jgi:hypothetical protein
MASTDTTRGEQSQPVFVALVEVAPLKGCEVVSSDVGGGFARCYVTATDRDAALDLIDSQLRELKFRVVGVQWCVPSDNVDWEHDGSPESNECMAAARESGEVVIGRLDTWTEN